MISSIDSLTRSFKENILHELDKECIKLCTKSEASELWKNCLTTWLNSIGKTCIRDVMSVSVFAQFAPCSDEKDKGRPKLYLPKTWPNADKKS